jgi:desulfoferrodoxin (superoxide reductase-like protein)
MKQVVVDALRRRVSSSGDSGAYSDHRLQPHPQKHDPFIVFAGDIATVKVRGPDASTTQLHPQTKDHFISFLWVEDQDGQVVHLAELKGFDASPSTEFSWTSQSGTLTPYSLCNLHGLWQGPTYTVELERETVPILGELDGSATGPKSYHSGSPQLVKHSPFVSSLANGVALMGVAGSDSEPTTVLHVQTSEHHIALIYVKDQHGAVVGLKKLGPTDGSQMHAVAVNSKVTELTPYEYCNLHGLWEGPKFRHTSEREL